MVGLPVLGASPTSWVVDVRFTKPGLVGGVVSRVMLAATAFATLKLPAPSRNSTQVRLAPSVPVRTKVAESAAGCHWGAPNMVEQAVAAVVAWTSAICATSVALEGGASC